MESRYNCYFQDPHKQRHVELYQLPHVPQSYVPQSRVQQSHVPQSRVQQSHVPQSLVPHPHVPQSVKWDDRDSTGLPAYMNGATDYVKLMMFHDWIKPDVTGRKSQYEQSPGYPNSHGYHHAQGLDLPPRRSHDDCQSSHVQLPRVPQSLVLLRMNNEYYEDHQSLLTMPLIVKGVNIGKMQVSNFSDGRKDGRDYAGVMVLSYKGMTNFKFQGNSGNFRVRSGYIIIKDTTGIKCGGGTVDAGQVHGKVFSQVFDTGCPDTREWCCIGFSYRPWRNPSWRFNSATFQNNNHNVPNNVQSAIINSVTTFWQSKTWDTEFELKLLQRSNHHWLTGQRWNRSRFPGPVSIWTGQQFSPVPVPVYRSDR